MRPTPIEPREVVDKVIFADFAEDFGMRANVFFFGKRIVNKSVGNSPKSPDFAGFERSLIEFFWFSIKVLLKFRLSSIVKR